MLPISDTNEWIYRDFPRVGEEWRNSAVGWVALADFPPFGAEVTPLYETDELVVVNGGRSASYGGRSASYGGRSASYGEDGTFIGCLPANNGQPEFENTIPEASVYQANLGHVPIPTNYSYSVPGPTFQADLTSALVP